MLELKIKFFRKDWSIKGQGIIFRSSLNVLVKKNKLAKIVFSILVLVAVMVREKFIYFKNLVVYYNLP